MQVKPSITKTLTERKTLLSGTATALREKLVASEAEDAATRKTLAEMDAEIADIDEFLSAPVEE